MLVWNYSGIWYFVLWMFLLHERSMHTLLRHVSKGHLAETLFKRFFWVVVWQQKRDPLMTKQFLSSSNLKAPLPSVPEWADGLVVLAPRLVLKCYSGNMTPAHPPCVPVDRFLISIWLFTSHSKETILLLALASTVRSEVTTNPTNISCLPTRWTEWLHVFLY